MARLVTKRQQGTCWHSLRRQECQRPNAGQSCLVHQCSAVEGSPRRGTWLPGVDRVTRDPDVVRQVFALLSDLFQQGQLCRVERRARA